MNRAMVLLCFQIAVGVTAAPLRVACEILEPVLNANHEPASAAAEDGKQYPVFRSASGALTPKVKHALSRGFAQQTLRLDRYARNLIAAHDGDKPSEWLRAPMYLLLSNRPGGFARFGFWLDRGATRRLVLAGYVDLVVTAKDVDSGDFEEIFSHELGHLILRALVGDIPAGPSRKMHASMTITDYPTAFDEGYAEHFQALASDARRGAGESAPSDLDLLWLSAADRQLRREGVPRNEFIHAKPLPSSALDPNPDRYRVFIDGETTTAFVPTELRSGQQMMASEGVIATLFYRIVTNEHVRAKYRDPRFYEQFLGRAVGRPTRVISPYENANLKLFAALAGMRIGRRPPIVEVFERYVELFADERRPLCTIFVETTWAATVSLPTARLMERAAGAGGRGDRAEYQRNRPFSALDDAIADVVNDRRKLDEEIGPELWIRNDAFRIANPIWSGERTEPMMMNLNTATEPEWMTIEGLDAATARRMTTLRHDRGFFRDFDEVLALVPTDIAARLRAMSVEPRLGGARRRE